MREVMVSDYWELVSERDEYAVAVVCPHGSYRAVVKWDGCVDFYQADNCDLKETPEGESTYIHYCNLQSEIDRLITLKAIYDAYFGDGVPDAP